MSYLGEIEAERRRQDAKWGEQNHPDADPVILDRLNRNDAWSTPSSVALRLAQEYEVPSAARAKFMCQFKAANGSVTWADILTEEFTEVIESIAECDSDKLHSELIQLAAVAVAWCEAISRRALSVPGGAS